MDVEPIQAAPQRVTTDLQQALHRLAPGDREVFLLGEVGGLSYAEIASMLDTTVPAVRSRIYRARQWHATAALPAPQRRVVAGPWARAAAALLLIAAGAGGGAWVHEYATRERPPEPDRVVQFNTGVDWGAQP